MARTTHKRPSPSRTTHAKAGRGAPAIAPSACTFPTGQDHSATPALDIRRIPIARINPAAYNPRIDLKPGDVEYERLARSVGEFGLVEPLVWNIRTGNLVGGHQRLKVLIARGDSTAEVSVVDLSPEREKALNLALNKVTGGWDPIKLAALLDELVRVPDFDVAITGFDVPEIDAIIAGALADNDRHEAFDVDAEIARAAAAGPPVTRPGDMVLLGRDPRLQHRLLCGDCTDAKQVRRLMAAVPALRPSAADNSAAGEDGRQGRPAGGGRRPARGTVHASDPRDAGDVEGPTDGRLRAALFATDPPYLVGYDGTNHPGGKPSLLGGKSPSRFQAKPSTKNKDWSGTYGVTWDDAAANTDLYDKFLNVGVQEAIRPDAPMYIWHASKRQAMLEQAMEKAGAFVHCQIIWVKNRPVLTRTWYAWRHEPCLMGWLKGNKPQGRRRGGVAGGMVQTGLPSAAKVPLLSTVWEIDTLPNGPERPDHPTPKPIEVFSIPMEQHTLPGDICYEPFAGSGTQIIAAQKTGRRCFGIEISPVYCDVIVRRFIAYAGEAAVDPAVAAKYRLKTTGGARPAPARDAKTGGAA